MGIGISPAFARGLLVGLASLIGIAPPAAAQSVADFYRKTPVTLQIGLPPGGGYDLYARALARHLGRNIPGNPSVIPKNMVGAGGTLAANYMYNVAPRDGSEIAMIQAPVIMLPVFGDPSAKFEPAKFTWIGSMNKDLSSCGVWQTANVKSFDDLFNKEVTFGASGAGGMLAQHPFVFRNLLGAKAKVILGYKGSNEVNLAMERGEVDGACALFVSTLETRWMEDWKSGRLKIIVQVGTENHPAFGDAPNIFSYAKTDEDRQVMQLVFGQSVMGRPLLAPPGIPADRRDALRKAMLDTLKDPAFVEEANKTRMEINPATAAEVEKLLQDFASYPPDVIAKAKTAIGN
jgi:tripartite-type tricarboxylate transporter receptor subunit TctC